jgi:hypothetical protein
VRPFHFGKLSVGVKCGAIAEPACRQAGKEQKMNTSLCSVQAVRRNGGLIVVLQLETKFLFRLFFYLPYLKEKFAT